LPTLENLYGGKKMKNFEDSDYALNKFSNGIVYRFMDEIIEVTLADYLYENPDKTAADFAELKAISDLDYLNQVRRDNALSRKSTFFSDVTQDSFGLTNSLEEIIIEFTEQERYHQERLAIAAKALDKLTEVQRRRYIKHHIEGLSTRAIAESEGVNNSKVIKSLAAANKKIKKFLDFVKNGGSNRL
jgi:DNA-directed RNA polymerase specialized sigma subunit